MALVHGGGVGLHGGVEITQHLLDEVLPLRGALLEHRRLPARHHEGEQRVVGDVALVLALVTALRIDRVGAVGVDPRRAVVALVEPPAVGVLPLPTLSHDAVRV